MNYTQSMDFRAWLTSEMETNHARRLAVRAVVDRVTVAGPGAVSVTMITPERLLGL